MGETESFQAAPQVDVQWFPRFKEASEFENLTALAGEKAYRAEQRERFLSGEIENPVLDYPNIDEEDLTRREQEFLALKKDILAGEENEIVKQVYRWRINEKIAGLRMLLAVDKGDTRRFKRYTEFIYGRPSPEIFAYTVQSLHLELEKCLDSENPELQKVAEELIRLLPQDLEGVKVFALPSEETVQLVQESTLKEIGSLVNIPEISGTLKAEDIKQVFEQSLQTLKVEGWQIVIDTGSATGIRVSQAKKEIKIPESRKLLFNRMRTLIAHEIGTHVARRIRGERSKLMLLGLGLDRYESGEEGIATMREQAIRGKLKDFSGLEGHLAISLACGLDGKPRDFRGVYEVLQKYFLFKQIIKGEDSVTAEKQAQIKAWNRCIRTFRGTGCSTAGTCFTKDIVYRKGNIGVWNVVKERPEEMQRFSVGKYDPANPRHIWVLEQLGITDKDLVSLGA